MGENISLALAGLKSNKMRAFLTMLGIIIGISSVIGIICVGDSLTAYMTDTMQGMGAGNIFVIVSERGQGMMGVSMDMPAVPAEDDLISDEQIEVFEERFAGRVKAVSISSGMGAGRAQDGRKYANVSITGVNEGYAVANDIDMFSGRFITERDSRGAKNVAVVSDFLVDAMFPAGTDPLGREIRVYRQREYQTYVIVGVYPYVPSVFTGFGLRDSRDTRTDMYIPLGVALQDAMHQNHQMFTAVAGAGEDAEILSGDIRAYWRQIYERNPRWNADVINMESMIETMGDVMGTLGTAVAIIAAISLLVGGIGVMNIMLVSVTERTREIGTRKALGARNSQIRIQFIVEAIIICLIGGFIGIILGLAMGTLGASILGFPMSIQPGIIILCVLFSMLVGVFFGSYPANKAAKLNPIDALRYE